MRSRKSFAGAIALLGGLAVLVVSLVSTPTAAQDTDDDDRGEIEILQTQVADLQTQVAVLQTQVAPTRPAATGATATPAEASVTCGRPFRSWGAGITDEVEVQLLQVREVADQPGNVAIELVITNGGDTPVEIHPDDFEVADCDGRVVTATGDGPEPAIAAGELAPGDSLRGWVTFPLAAGAQAADFTFHVRSQDRTGAQVSCPLVDREASPAALDEASGGAGCSATGGSA